MFYHNFYTDKTKLVWLGKKRHSIDKLHVSQCLQWGSTEFQLLGLNYSVDLEKMEALNYSIVINTIKTDIRNWHKRKLTPLVFNKNNTTLKDKSLTNITP